MLSPAKKIYERKLYFRRTSTTFETFLDIGSRKSSTLCAQPRICACFSNNPLPLRRMLLLGAGIAGHFSVIPSGSVWPCSFILMRSGKCRASFLSTIFSWSMSSSIMDKNSRPRKNRCMKRTCTTSARLKISLVSAYEKWLASTLTARRCFSTTMGVVLSRVRDSSAAVLAEYMKNFTPRQLSSAGEHGCGYSYTG